MAPAMPPSSPARSTSLLKPVETSRRIELAFSAVSAYVPKPQYTATPVPAADGAAPAAADGPPVPEAAPAHLPNGRSPDATTSAEEDATAAAPAAAAAAGVPAGHRQVLFDVRGTVEPTQVLALMGPSGSGKTSLLTLLGGRSTAKSSGTITFNGAALTKPVKRKLGYVAQDDLLFAELTVYETLYFAALLRLPRTWARGVKLERVEAVLQALGLVKCRDTMVGGQMLRGVSGGERKRVSIGHELLINPSLILLDEPTSGLDSTTALRLMVTLRALAAGGRTVVCSIHQPASRIFQQMDKLLLLSEGRTLFFGDAAAAANWFERLDVGLPFGVSLADHILDLASGDLVGQDTEEGKRTLTQLVASFGGRSEGCGKGGVLNADVGASPYPEAGCGEEGGADLLVTARADGWGGAAAGSSGDGGGASASGAEVEEEVDDDKWGASWVDQVKLLTVRSLKTRRLGALSWQKFGEVWGVGIACGLFWWQVGGAANSVQVQDVSGLLLFILMFMSFFSLFTALFTFPPEFQTLLKERQSGMFRLSAYYVARAAADIPMDCTVPAVFCVIVYFMTGLRLTAGAFFSFQWTVLLLVLVAQSIGLLISATVSNPLNSVTLASVVMLTVVLVSGFFVRSIPVWIAWLKYLSFVYYGYNLLLKIEFSHRPYPCGQVLLDNPGAAPLPDPTHCDVAQARLFNFDLDAPVTEPVLVLLLFLAAFRLAIYFALRHKTTFRPGGPR